MALHFFQGRFRFRFFVFLRFWPVQGLRPRASVSDAARLFPGIAGVPALVDATRGCFLLLFSEALPGAHVSDVPMLLF